jgi:hypothetical protein
MARPTASKKHRTTIGHNPLDALLSPASKEAPKKEATTNGGPEPQRMGKERATYHLPSALVDEVRDVVVALSGPPLRLTLASFAERAFRTEIERLKREHNKGRPFPKRDGELRGGRPIGS